MNDEFLRKHELFRMKKRKEKKEQRNFPGQSFILHHAQSN